MPEKRLVEGELQTEDGEVCALGCLGNALGRALREVDAQDWDKLGELFDIAPQLAQEVMFINDDRYHVATPELRWRLVRDWAARQIRIEAGDLK
jgi:hypothetical protein